MVPPALVTAIDTLELSLPVSTKVPPARTGFAVMPMLLKPKLVPDTIFEVAGVDDPVVGAAGGTYTDRVATLPDATSGHMLVHGPT